MNGPLEFMETRKVCLLLYLQKLSIRLRFPLKSAKMRFYCTYNLEKSATGYFHYATLNIIAIEFALYLHRKIWCSTTSCIMRIYFGQIFIHIFWPVSFLIRHPSKTPFKAPFKNRFFGIRYPYPRSGALTIMIVNAWGKGYLVPKKRFLKCALKGVLEGYLIKWLGP